MARFELPIYGNDDDITRIYETDHVRWGIFIQAVKAQEEIADKSVADQLITISQFMKKIFPGITDAELECADGNDVLNTFRQLASNANAIGENSKNA